MRDERKGGERASARAKGIIGLVWWLGEEELRGPQPAVRGRQDAGGILEQLLNSN